MKRPPAVNFLVAVALFTAAAVALYWATWFLAPDQIQSVRPGSPSYPAYVVFEQAFLLADSWLAICALIAAAGLWRMRDWGLLFMLLAGGSAIFLGLMDLLYDLQHGIFVPITPEAAIELAIVILTLALGSVSIGLGWRQRKRFICD